MSFHLLHLHSFPIQEQLKIEESLLRLDTRNFCIINEGSSDAIVMGISGKEEEWIDLEKANNDQIPILKRFSGGGTVIVDENTLFITFICEKSLHPFPAFPEQIMRWTEKIYRGMFPHEAFCLRENDFVIGDKKIGGNAQYIKKQRWLHHTSFLWDYSEKKMEYLRHPKKTPPYRAARAHKDFLCRLSNHFSDRGQLIANLKKTLDDQYGIIPISLEDITPLTLS